MVLVSEINEHSALEQKQCCKQGICEIRSMSLHSSFLQISIPNVNNQNGKKKRHSFIKYNLLGLSLCMYHYI
jgi:hypothetical protein